MRRRPARCAHESHVPGRANTQVAAWAKGLATPRPEENERLIRTSDLIDTLAAQLVPVRPLRPPLLRALGWLALAAVVLVMLATAQGVRGDLQARLHDPAFLLTIGGALLTGVLAAVAAFMLSVPDRSGLWLLLPAPALVLWLSSVGAQCLTAWVSLDPAGMHLGETARCFATLVLTSLPLSLALLLMLRRAAPLRPLPVSLAGSIAVAALTASALSVFHRADATALILAWNLGTTALFAALAAAFGRRLLGPPAPAARRARERGL